MIFRPEPTQAVSRGLSSNHFLIEDYEVRG